MDFSPKKVLIVFDEYVLDDDLSRALSSYFVGSTTLFPLTSKWDRIHEVEGICQEIVRHSESIQILDSGDLIDQEVDDLRGRVAQWSAELGDFVVDGRTLKEWFLIETDNVSPWWFSLLAEKNTQKTNAFFKIAQLQAFDALLSRGVYDVCLVGHSDEGIAVALRKVSERHCTETVSVRSARQLPCKSGTTYVRELLLMILSRMGWGGPLLRGIGGWARANWRSLLAHRILKRPREVPNKGSDTVLFVTYFPVVDSSEAKRGIFRNKMAGRLQEELVRSGKNIVWICLYIPYDGYNYSDAARLMRRFLEKGEAIYLIEEFISLKGSLRALYRWVRQALIYLRLRPRLQHGILWKGLAVPESNDIIKAMMDESFVGWTGLAGLLFLEGFKEVFTRWQSASQCIYYLEMHEWEKALNAARRIRAPQITTIGFQHTHVTRNLFHYRLSPSDLSPESGPTSMPQPDVYACNGDVPLEYMAEGGLKNLRKVEAIRHLYLKQRLNSDPKKQGKANIVLVAGTISEEETRGIISFLYETFPHARGFRVWLKGHPSLPIETVLTELGIVVKQAGWEIRREPLAELLLAARVVLVGGSSVAIEALANGCSVIVPVLPDCMFMSPLAGFEDYYARAISPEQLRNRILSCLSGEKRMQQSEVRYLIEAYWCLDESLKRWKELVL